MGIEVLDPSYELDSAQFVPANRIATLQGATVGLLSNGKEGTKAFFDGLEQALCDDHGVARIVRVTKKNYSAPAEPELMEQSAGWDALIAGIGD